MAFDGLVTYTIVNELQSHLIDGKIDKIFEPNNNEILVGVYGNGIKYALDIVVSSNNYRLCLTTSAKPNPSFAPNFCMVLRKHLLNTRIINISTLGLERIVTIEFEGHSKSDNLGNKKLIIELMGKHSNIILVNSEGIIIDALRHFHIEEHSYRNILPNYKYILPISNKLDITKIESKEEFYTETSCYIENNFSKKESLQLSEVISSTYTGISKSSMTSIIQELKIDDVFCQETMDKFYEHISNMLKNPSNTMLQFVSDKDYSPFALLEKNSNDLQANYFIDDYYSKKETSENFITYRNNLSKLILSYMKKLNQKLSNINRKLEECQNTDLYKLYGELITNNLYRIGQNHLEEITLENYYEQNAPVTISLDKSISPALNAKNYFKKYHKLKNAKLIVEEQKKEVQDEINYLESIIYEFQAAKTITDIDIVYSEFTESFSNKNNTSSHQKNKLKKNKKVSKKDIHAANQIGEPLKYQIDGFIILVGRNNRQNDYITKHAHPDDIWFHTKDIHGSHVILKVEQKTPSQDTINRIAAIAAFYSKASKSSNVPVDYTNIKYVKKPSNAKPGMVIYTNHKNVIVKPCIPT